MCAGIRKATDGGFFGIGIGFREQFREDVGRSKQILEDVSGQRVRKVWEKAPGLVEERIYLAGFEIFRGAEPLLIERACVAGASDVLSEAWGYASRPVAGSSYSSSKSSAYSAGISAYTCRWR